MLHQGFEASGKITADIQYVMYLCANDQDTNQPVYSPEEAMEKDTTIDRVHAASDEMLSAFRQSSVLNQANKTETEFYSGK